MQRFQTQTQNQIHSLAPHRWLHSAVLYKHYIFIFGGFGSFVRTNDLYKFDFITKRWELVIPNGKIPSPRAGHTAQVYENSMYIVGGLCGHSIMPILADTYKYDFEKNEWNYISYTGELPQIHSHSMTTYKQFFYVFGGYTTNEQTYSNQLFKFDIIKSHWSKVNYHGNIPALCGCSIVCYGDVLLVFGGTIHGESLLYQYNILKNEWKRITMDGDIPCSRVGHSANLYGPYMIILGGHSRDHGCCNTMYKWNIIHHKWSLVDCNNILKRLCHISIIDEDRLLIHGGSSIDDTYFNDVFIYEFGNGLKSCLWKALIRKCEYDVIFL